MRLFVNEKSTKTKTKALNFRIAEWGREDSETKTKLLELLIAKRKIRNRIFVFVETTIHKYSDKGVVVVVVVVVVRK